MVKERWKLDEHSAREEWLLSCLARQASVVEALAGDARDATDEAASCLAWWGARRQARRYQRALRSRMWAIRVRERWGREVAHHHALLEGICDDSQAALSAAEGQVAARARLKLGARVAFVGKGGAGKSLVSGTLARLLARRGRNVLAGDLDTSPGMAFSLGLPADAGVLPPDAVERHDGAAYGWRLRDGLEPVQAVERFSCRGPDGVRLLTLGKIDDLEKRAPKRSLVALLEVLQGFGEPTWDVIGDLEAGPTTPFERYHSFAETALVVVGPAWRSGMTARRLVPMVDDIATLVVANGFGAQPDHPALPSCVRIPFDPEVAEAERHGLAPVDECPESPTVKAISQLADVLSHGESAT